MEGKQPYLGDLPTMVINHLLIGMILSRDHRFLDLPVWCLEKVKPKNLPNVGRMVIYHGRIPKKNHQKRHNPRIWDDWNLVGGWNQPICNILYSQIGSFPRVEVKIKHCWNHHLELEVVMFNSTQTITRLLKLGFWVCTRRFWTTWPNFIPYLEVHWLNHWKGVT